MKRTRHKAEQIVNKLREADAMLAAGRTVAQFVQQLGVSEAGDTKMIPPRATEIDLGGRSRCGSGGVCATAASRRLRGNCLWGSQGGEAPLHSDSG